MTGLNASPREKPIIKIWARTVARRLPVSLLPRRVVLAARATMVSSRETRARAEARSRAIISLLAVIFCQYDNSSRRPRGGLVTASHAHYLTFPESYDGTKPVSGSGRSRLRDRVRSRCSDFRCHGWMLEFSETTSHESTRCRTICWRASASITSRVFCNRRSFHLQNSA